MFFRRSKFFKSLFLVIFFICILFAACNQFVVIPFLETKLEQISTDKKFLQRNPEDFREIQSTHVIGILLLKSLVWISIFFSVLFLGIAYFSNRKKE